MKKFRQLSIIGILIIFSSSFLNAQPLKVRARSVWPIEKAKQWYNKHNWIIGANFIPSTAINQLEMWQPDTFDPATIDRELGYAEGIGFNTMRVFLHSVAYQQNAQGFKYRVRQYLTIANKHHIKTIFVFFDDCWNSNPRSGKQPEPKIGVHNSGWLQDPGVSALKYPNEMAMLHTYVNDMMRSFSHDERILFWDLYNEPGNNNKRDTSLNLLTKVFAWAHEINTDQPVSAGLWNWDYGNLNLFQTLNSDILTYHDYEDEITHERVIELLKTHGKPLICTEYMARLRKSTFSNILPILKKENVGAINWGLVAGKTNTIYAWDSPMPKGEEPEIWFHDIFRKDGTPYQPTETEFIKKIIGRSKAEGSK